MFDLETARRWTRRSALAHHASVTPTGITRRQVLSISAIGTGLLLPSPSWAQAAEGLFATPFGAEIILGGRSWLLRYEAFGLRSAAAISITTTPENRIAIAGATWPGTGITFDLDLAFEQAAAGWMIEARSTALGLIRKIPFADFLDGAAQLETTMSATTSAAMVRKLRWSPTAVPACSLRLRPDLAWEISAATLRCTADKLAAARALTVKVSKDGGGAVVGKYLAGGRGWSTEVTGSAATPTARPLLKCGTLADGSTAELRCISLSEAVTAVNEAGQSTVALVGVWRMHFTTDVGRSGGFRSVNGLVLLGAKSLSNYVVASLPVDDTSHSVSLPGGSPDIRGESDDDQIELIARDGVIEQCQVKALVTTIGLPLDGADACELVLEERPDGPHQVSFFLDDRRIPDSPWTITYSLLGPERWRLPLRYGSLRVSRARDLIDLNYRFQGLALVRRIGGWRLELDGSDMAPIMVAEFPPQHVLERAFFHQDLPASDGLASVKPVVQTDDSNPRTDNGLPLDNKGKQERLDADFPLAGKPVGNDEPLVRVVEARLSGRSRLAFAVPTKKRDVQLGFDFASLTNFAALTLVVAPAARREMADQSQDETLIPETDPIAILKKRGIEPGSRWADRRSQMLAAVVDPPDPFATAIELPARLFISPDQNAHFTSRSFAPSTFDRQAAPLWSVRLALDDVAETSHAPIAHIRAIHSPDFEPAAFTPGGTSPRQSHVAPWEYNERPSPRNLRLPMSVADRHELVALSSLYGMPTLPRLPAGPRSPNTPVTPIPDNIPAPPDWRLSEAEDEQGIYIPPPMAVRELALSAMGGSLDMLARFEPPAAPYRKGRAQPLFDALNIEGWTQRTILGRDVSVELIYKGFLFPLGIRAALLKRTERYFLRGPGENKPTAYLIQHYFIQLPKPEKQYPGLGHPFDARDFPSAKINFRTRQTPDLLDPFAATPATAFSVSPEGIVRLPADLDGTGLAHGLAFWPRTRSGLGGEVQFEYEAVGQPGTMTSPLLFLDNTAAHDPATVLAAHHYYQNEVVATSGLKTVTMRGAARRYAPEREPGSATFETARWILGVRGRGDSMSPYQMDGAMEGADQPPFYPYVREAHLRLGSVQRFSGRPDDLVVTSFDPLFTRSALSSDANPAQSYLAVHGYLPTDRKQWFADAVIEPARLNVTGVGDRSGGICQPNQLVIAMSLTNGTIGGTTLLPRPLFFADPSDPVRKAGPVPFLAAPVDAPSPNTARSGVFAGADFFPSDARLLGLLSLSDLVKTALYAAAPKLIETLELADEEASKQLATVLAAVRSVIEQVAPPLGAVAETLNKPGPGSLPSPATLYPRLAAAVAAIQAALDALVHQLGATNGTISRLPALGRAANDLLQAINELIAELDRIGHHPMPSLVDGILAQLSELATIVRDKGAFGALVQAEVKKLLNPLVMQALASENRLWLAITFGVDPKQELKADQEALFAALIATANEAAANEAVGKPILKAIAAVDSFAKRIDSAQGDVRQIALRGFELVDKLIAALSGALAGPLATAQQGGLQLCAIVGATISQVIADGSLISLGKIDEAIAKIDLPLSAMAALEAQIEDGVAAFDRIGAPPGADEHYRALRSRVHAARELVIRLRSGTAGTLDRLRDARKGLADDAERTQGALKHMCGVDPATLSLPLGAFASWMKIRIQFLEDTLLLLTRVAEALVTPPRSGRVATTSFAELEQIAKSVEGLAGQVGTQVKALLLGVIDIIGRVTSVTRSAQPMIAAVSPVLSYFDPATQTSIQGVIDEAKARAAAISAQLAALETRIKGLTTTSPADIARAMSGNVELAAALRAYARDGERRLIGVILPSVVSAAGPMQQNLRALGENVRKAIVGSLLIAHEEVLEQWTGLLDANPNMLDALGAVVNPDRVGALIERGPNTLHQALVEQVNELRRARDMPLGDALPILRGLRDRVDLVRRDPNTRAYSKAPALYCFARELGGLLDTILHGQLGQLIDVDRIRSLVAKMLFTIPLPDLDVSYSFGTTVNDLPPFFAMNASRDLTKDDLSLSFKLHASIADRGKTTMTASGALQAFDISIPEIVTLQFEPVNFVSTNGSKPDFDIRLKPDGILLGPAVAFIEKLSDYLGTKGNGFYIDLRFDPPGVEAGFAFNLGTISLGEVSFLNVSLGASVELPFDNRAAIFRFNLAFRETPFLISVAPFGGGGFLSVAFDAKGVVGFEAAFEYGGVIAFGFGPLSGQGMVLTGIYLSRSAAYTRVTGFFLAAGSAHIACFGLGASLYVGVEQQDGGRVQGHAQYTFSFSIGLGSIDFKVPLDRLIPQGWGAGGSSHNSSHSAQLQSPAFTAAAAKPVTRPAIPLEAPRVRTTAKAMVEDWSEYLTYFDEDL